MAVKPTRGWKSALVSLLTDNALLGEYKPEWGFRMGSDPLLAISAIYRRHDPDLDHLFQLAWGRWKYYQPIAGSGQSADIGLYIGFAGYISGPEIFEALDELAARFEATPLGRELVSHKDAGFRGALESPDYADFRKPMPIAPAPGPHTHTLLLRILGRFRHDADFPEYSLQFRLCGSPELNSVQNEIDGTLRKLIYATSSADELSSLIEAWKAEWETFRGLKASPEMSAALKELAALPREPYRHPAYPEGYIPYPSVAGNPALHEKLLRLHKSFEDLRKAANPVSNKVREVIRSLLPEPKWESEREFNRRYSEARKMAENGAVDHGFLSYVASLRPTAVLLPPPSEAPVLEPAEAAGGPGTDIPVSDVAPVIPAPSEEVPPPAQVAALPVPDHAGSGSQDAPEASYFTPPMEVVPAMVTDLPTQEGGTPPDEEAPLVADHAEPQDVPEATDSAFPAQDAPSDDVPGASNVALDGPGTAVPEPAPDTAPGARISGARWAGAAGVVGAGLAVAAADAAGTKPDGERRGIAFRDVALVTLAIAAGAGILFWRGQSLSGPQR